MTTTTLSTWASTYGVGRRHVDFSVRSSTPTTGAMTDRDAQGQWRVVRGGTIIHRENKILDFQWLGLNGDIVYARAVDSAGNAGDWESYTYVVTANTAADWVRYVDTGGNDTTGDGSEGNPWATVTKAVTEAQSALTSGQVGVIFLSDDQTHSSSTTVITGSDATPCLVRFVRKGGGSSRPEISVTTDTIGFKVGKRGTLHIDGCDIACAATTDVNPVFDLRRSGGVVADQSAWNFMAVDCDVTGAGRGLNVDWGLTSADRDAGSNDFVALQNVSFTGTRWFHVYGMFDTNRTMFRDVTFGTHTAFGANPFRVFRVGRMYCEDVLFDTADSGSMRLSVTVGSNDYDAMREVTLNRVTMRGTSASLNSIAIQPDATMSGAGIVRDVRFVDCRMLNAHYSIQADISGSNGLNTSRIDYLECISAGTQFLVVSGSGSVSHTHNSIRLRNCGSARNYGGGTAYGFGGAESRYASGSIQMHGCWSLYGAGTPESRRFVNASGMTRAQFIAKVAAMNYNHALKSDGNSVTFAWFSDNQDAIGTWQTQSGLDANSTVTLSSTGNLTNTGFSDALLADFRLASDSGPLAGTGYPLPLGVSIDADGYLRSATTPDAGPYEYGATDTPEDPEIGGGGGGGSGYRSRRRMGLRRGLR